MGFSDDNQKYLKRLNRVKIPVALFHDAIRSLEDLGEDVNVPGYKEGALGAFFRGRGLSRTQSFQYLEALCFRMQALMRLRNEPGGRQWDAPGSGTAEGSYDPYLFAAAKEPLIEQGQNQVAFDRERFRARMLSMQS